MRAPAGSGDDGAVGGGRMRRGLPLAKRRRNRSGDGRSSQRARARSGQDDGILPILAKAVREVERAVDRGQLTSGQRARFQAVALLARAERANRADEAGTAAQTELAAQAARGTGHDPGPASRPVSPPCSACSRTTPRSPTRPDASSVRCSSQRVSSRSPSPSQTVLHQTASAPDASPQSVVQAQLANPFLVPDFSQTAPRAHGRLAGWELIEPLLNSFEQAARAPRRAWSSPSRGRDGHPTSS